MRVEVVTEAENDGSRDWEKIVLRTNLFQIPRFRDFPAEILSPITGAKAFILGSFAGEGEILR